MSKVRFNPAGAVMGLDVPQDLLYKHSESITAKLESGSVISQIGLESKLPDFQLEIGPSRQVNLHAMPELDEQGRLLNSAAATMDCLLIFPDRIVGYNPFPVVLLAGTKLSNICVSRSIEGEARSELSKPRPKKAA